VSKWMRWEMGFEPFRALFIAFFGLLPAEVAFQRGDLLTFLFDFSVVVSVSVFFAEKCSCPLKTGLLQLLSNQAFCAFLLKTDKKQMFAQSVCAFLGSIIVAQFSLPLAVFSAASSLLLFLSAKAQRMGSQPDVQKSPTLVEGCSSTSS